LSILGVRHSPNPKPAARFGELTIVGTESCQARHVGVVHSGRIAIKREDGTEVEIGPVLRAGSAWLRLSRSCHDARVSRVRYRELPGDALAAGLAGAALSAIPSTVWSLVRGEDALEGGRAVGAMVLRDERRTGALLAIAAPVHLAISLGWAAVMAAALPRGREPARGVVGGIVIATLDLALVGRRIPSIAALPQGRQWADHAAYGLTVGLVLRARRARHAT
jgi:hypothetical protein